MTQHFSTYVAVPLWHHVFTTPPTGMCQASTWEVDQLFGHRLRLDGESKKKRVEVLLVWSGSGHFDESEHMASDL